jgi:SAM-dependent methyltransferase
MATKKSSFEQFGIASWDCYTSLVSKSSNLAETVGRPPNCIGMGKNIWNDIKNKFNLKNIGSFLDIGCGFGEVTECMLQDPVCSDIFFTLVDAPEILAKIKSDFSSLVKDNTLLVPGYFPNNKNYIDSSKKFEYILAYSVLHCTDSPMEFIESAVHFLAPGGKLLLGDFANVHKKGRFVSTSYGRKFEAEYKNIDINDVPFYKDQFAFFDESVDHNKLINDELLFDITKRYRNRGYEVYVLPQPPELPFSKTREDILITSLV